jgi:hypothetical protein
MPQANRCFWDGSFPKEKKWLFILSGEKFLKLFAFLQRELSNSPIKITATVVDNPEELSSFSLDENHSFSNFELFCNQCRQTLPFYQTTCYIGFTKMIEKHLFLTENPFFRVVFFYLLVFHSKRKL